MRFDAFEVSLQFVRSLRAVLARLDTRDTSLATQIKRAAASVPLKPRPHPQPQPQPQTAAAAAAAAAAQARPPAAKRGRLGPTSMPYTLLELFRAGATLPP